MSMNSGLPPNPNSLKSKLTKGLLRALMRINSRPHQQKPRSPREIQRRHRLIKAAAYGSMASSVGNRRAWSRALLWKIRNQTSRRGPHSAASSCRRRRTSIARHQLSYSMMKKRIGELQKENLNNMRRNRVVEVGGDGSGQVDKLRSLVPGGRVMEPFRLLEETAHYMKCLATQVKVMTSILEIYTTATSIP